MKKNGIKNIKEMGSIHPIVTEKVDDELLEEVRDIEKVLSVRKIWFKRK